jgi:hypothetical protein
MLVRQDMGMMCDHDLYRVAYEAGFDVQIRLPPRPEVQVLNHMQCFAVLDIEILEGASVVVAVPRIRPFMSRDLAECGDQAMLRFGGAKAPPPNVYRCPQRYIDKCIGARSHPQLILDLCADAVDIIP